MRDLGYILVVEDEYLIAVELVDALERRGASIIGPVSGIAEALQALGDAPTLNGAIVDLNLRGELAFPVADLLLEKQIPTILTSGYDRSALPGRFAAMPLIEKPFNVAEVVEILARAIASV